ncbi:hypothetical protein SARC_09329 [Sphaeroforma arctica JP610]|uniref:Uncharacterized protein n=1 Tax=Sphaeroforma arctica JP610 TaxID=667725 RepID=A0A0L0FN69_9EUKA|nr:hypothetical protein SARC_09329 [Sphaeroforma arctica JP610]KNC78235.1 hypothetical protein SARC_09329 [Sphaeroforma arctica JP610]|eukprot:XP_014152137.1 hypothetical protein SARC_09329 [Sphaeroforma arctica JP610]
MSASDTDDSEIPHSDRDLTLTGLNSVTVGLTTILAVLEYNPSDRPAFVKDTAAQTPIPEHANTFTIAFRERTKKNDSCHRARAILIRSLSKNLRQNLTIINITADPCDLMLFLMNKYSFYSDHIAKPIDIAYLENFTCTDEEPVRFWAERCCKLQSDAKDQGLVFTDKFITSIFIRDLSRTDQDQARQYLATHCGQSTLDGYLGPDLRTGPRALFEDRT